MRTNRDAQVTIGWHLARPSNAATGWWAAWRVRATPRGLWARLVYGRPRSAPW